MLDQITLLCKSGKLKEAADQLYRYATHQQLGQDTLSDIIVLSGNINELIKQEKRRKISAQEALDIKTRYAFEMEDILAELRPLPTNNTGAAQHAVSPNTSPESFPEQNHRSMPNNAQLNNQVNVTVNLSIENIITTEIHQNIQGLQQGAQELENELKNNAPDDTSKEELESALQAIEDLQQEVSKLQQAKKKEELPPVLKKVEAFFNKLNDGNNTLSKVYKVSKQGAETLQKIGRNYNAIAQWVGTPQIPGVLLGKESA